MFLANQQTFFLLLLLMQVILIKFAQHTKADVIKECVNYTTCTETYADLYSALASPKNYFNIALALYPARKPSSVLVHVNLHRFNQTEKSSPVSYTWSMSCLYTAFPATVLELLSLGSILVTSRKRTLDITIEPFCCKVSENDRLILIERVLAELQDLAQSPKIEDPTLNTAECVIKGHDPDISCTGRSAFIRAMLWCSFTFTILFGPLTALIIFVFFDEAKNDKTKDKKKKQNLSKAVKYSSYFLLAVEIVLLITIIVYSVQGNAPWDTYLILVTIALESLVGLALRKSDYFAFLPQNKKLGKLGIFLWANLTMYYFSWLVIGIMVNPLWGFTVLLVICVVIAATVYLVYQFISFYDPGFCIRLRNLAVCGAILCSIFSLVTVVLLAGQSFFGRETANDVVRTALLYATTAFVSWILAKINVKDGGKKKEEENTPLTQKDLCTCLQAFLSKLHDPNTQESSS